MLGDVATAGWAFLVSPTRGKRPLHVSVYLNCSVFSGFISPLVATERMVVN
jgi:hypothetical protein